jgi:chromosome segregation ATPase
LGAHLKNWKSKQNQTQQIATQENIPEELISALKGIWERVTHYSEEKIQSIHQETQQALLQLKQELQYLQKENASLQQQNLQLKQERDGIVHEKLALEQLLSDAKIDVLTLKEKISGLEQHSQEKQERMDELRQQNHQIQANLEHYRDASLEQRRADQQRYEQQQKQLEQALHHANQTLEQLQREKTALQQHYQKANLERDHLKLQLEKLHAQQEAMATHQTDILNELAKKTQNQQHWQTQYHALQVKFDEQNKSLIELQAQHAVTSQQWITIKADLKDMREQNKVLAHEKWVLGQEKAQLYGQLKQLESSI